MNESIILGPTKAGKTSMLAALETACARADTSLIDTSVRLRPRSQQMANLMEYARAAISTRKTLTESSRTGAQFDFELHLTLPRQMLTLQQKILRRSEGVTAAFRVFDGPGGWIFTEGLSQAEDALKIKEYRQQVVVALRAAPGLILCIDSQDFSDAKQQAVFCQLPSLLHDTGLSKLPATRVFICLTKADARFADKGYSALHFAEEADARDHLNRLFSKGTQTALRDFLNPDAKIGFGWTSPYGFIEDGSPNYCSERDSILPAAAGGGITDMLNAWTPYRILDPFLFLMGVDVIGVQTMTAREWLTK